MKHNTKSVRKTVKNFTKKFCLYKPDYNALKSAAAKSGYTLIEYSKLYNKDNIAFLINSLGISEFVSCSHGFTYANEKYRIIFVDEDLSEEEKAIVTAHELGHIHLNHLSSASVLGNDVREEYEAGVFAHFLLNQNIFGKFIHKHKKLVAVVSLVAILSVLSIAGMKIYKRQQSYYGEYYTTTTGKKYHKKECAFIKSKSNIKRLTKKEFESKEYSACSMCLPDK